ncbi:MAG: MMPL family transporter [Clostridiales bacterium]|nr:MMPL family transporter [Clostridiales bacterium]
MKKIAKFIVEKRLWLFFIFVAIIGYCIFGITRIEVEYDITTYLPDGTDTKKALAIMEEEFASLGTATVMVKNVAAAAADGIADSLRGIDGVTSVTFDSASESNFKDGKALYNIFYVGDSGDKKAVEAYNQTIKVLDKSGYKYGVPTPLVNDFAQTLASEMVIIIAISAAVILAVLLFTSKSFAEVLAFPIVFVVAAVLNMGTNHWLGKISFISNTVCIILQLALAIDYAIILCHRFTEEKDKTPDDPKGALITALAKAIPEIASSSLTTVAGLVALMFMQLGLGFDLGMVLAKSIVCSLLTVFLLMPCILLWLTKPMDKTRHRSFVPKVRLLGVGVIKIRYALVAVFVALFGVCAWLSQTITYCYSQDSIDTSRPTDTVIAQREMEKTFGASNTFVILLPKDTDPDLQRKVMSDVQELSVVGDKQLITQQPLGWAAISLPSRTDQNKQYYLTDEIKYTELKDIIEIDDGTARMLFFAYAMSHGGYGEGGSLQSYAVPIGDLVQYVFDNPEMLGAAGDGASDILEYKSLLEFGRSQLVGDKHYRLVFNISSSVESEQTFKFIERLYGSVKKTAPKAIFAGSSMSAYDLNGSFQTDNLLITLLTIAFIFIILAVTFRSWGIPVVLVAVIQGAIFINFTIPVMLGNNLFFFVYLIASAIQMGATIDYAILMTNRYMNGNGLSNRDAVIGAISAAFPTIVTSGTIMTVASFLVGFMTSNPLIASMGMTLGFGTIISIICVLFVLPALLYILGPLLKKTVIGRKRKGVEVPPAEPTDGCAMEQAEQTEQSEPMDTIDQPQISDT